MRMTLLAMVAGLILGTVLGCLVAFLLTPPAEPEAGWTTATLTDLTKPREALRREVRASVLDPRVFLLIGVLLGGGFGALVGALLGATRSVILAIEGRTTEAG
jgi:hypothetical protein